jgi:hypothetical protein
LRMFAHVCWCPPEPFEGLRVFAPVCAYLRMFVQRLCSVCAAFVQRLRSVCAASAQHFLSVCAVFAQCLCSVYVSILSYTHCLRRDMFAQCLRSVCADLICLRSVCADLFLFAQCLRSVCAVFAQTCFCLCNVVFCANVGLGQARLRMFAHVCACLRI